MAWSIGLIPRQILFIPGKARIRMQSRILKCCKRILHDRPIILGIESSCDDTGCGIVDTDGNILGEAVDSQHLTHLKYGGIIPVFAKKMHNESITSVCEAALRSANLKLRDIDAIATTVKPGLPMSLQVGTNFGKYLSSVGNKPFIPIHHMEAHALTARISEKVEFPYLVLLVSGGHSLLAIVENVDKFYLLGSTLDNAPGQIVDKVARKLKLNSIPELAKLSGGRAVEVAACKASNVDVFQFSPVLTTYYNCNFSFAGTYSTAVHHIKNEEQKYQIKADEIIPSVYDLCASFQMTIVNHICQRTQRAMEYIDLMELIPADKRTLVISGGVACNDLLARALSILCQESGFGFVRTPPKLCTDNGIMIAWNGAERWLADKGVLRDPNEIANVAIEKKAPLGEDLREKVEGAQLKCKWIKIKRKLL